jgi:hypothetical protein
MDQEQYSTAGTYPKRLFWFQHHWETVSALTTVTPCLCKPYRDSFESFRTYANERPLDLVTIRNATDFFLAYQHHLRTVSAGNFRKALRAKR